jgi:hypothetical protein
LKRPDAHATDARGDALFREVFAAWGVNPSERDYGWDYVVEVFREAKSTGLLFSAQLKSSTVSAYSADESFISQPLEREAAEYLATQLKQPTFLFHADVERRRLYWSTIQLDAVVLRSLEAAAAGSLTVRVPTANLLPEAFEHFLLDLRTAHCVVTSRALLIATDTDFISAMLNRPVQAMDELSDQLRGKAFRIEMQAAHEIFRHGDIPEAKRRLNQILAGSDVPLDVRFNVTFQLGELEWVELSRSEQPQIRIVERQLSTASELCRIARKGPRYLRMSASMIRMVAELAVITHRGHGLTMNWIAHRKVRPDPIWLAVLSFELDRNLAAAGKKYKHGLRLVAMAVSSPRWRVPPAPLVKMATCVRFLAGVLDQAEFKEAGRQYRKSGLELLRLAAAVASQSADLDGQFQVATTALLLDDSPDGEGFALWHAMVDRWSPESEYRKRAEAFADRVLQRRGGVKFESDIKTTARQVHENLLAAFGIDPASEPWASMINLAITDADPTRVLKGCDHIFVLQVGRDPILDRLGLEHAGPKALHCTLHGYAVTGRDLDSVDEAFRREYCDSCPDRAPRPPGWKFSPE